MPASDHFSQGNTNLNINNNKLDIDNGDNVFGTNDNIQPSDNTVRDTSENEREDCAKPDRSDLENEMNKKDGKFKKDADDYMPIDKDKENGDKDVLEKVLDQLSPFGWYQKYMLVMLCIPNLLSSMYTLNYVFVADQVPFRCAVPECEGTSGLLFNDSSGAHLVLDSTQCHRYEPLVPTNATCDREQFHMNNTVPCDLFVYETGDTVFAEFDLGCQDWRRALVGTVRNSALPLALILTGFISDGWGRRTAFCLFSACAGLMGIVKGFSVNYSMYLTMEFLEAALGYGFSSAAYVMMVELARPSLRASFACATGVAYGFGGVLFGVIASRVRYWRELLWCVYTPALLLPLYWLAIDESVRWMHATGATDRAVSVVKKAARWNKVRIDEDLLRKLHESSLENQESRSSQGRWKPWKSLLTSRPLLLRLSLCGWCWIASSFVYYGLTINVVSLHGDKYVNFSLNMAMEMVASLVLMMLLEKLGRQWTICVSFLLCGIACLMPLFVSHNSANLALFFVGKMAITMAFNSAYVFTAELFPTGTRSSAVAACSLIGRLGSILAPLTTMLGMQTQAWAYGVVSLLAALGALLLPETRRANLPQNTTDAEALH